MRDGFYTVFQAGIDQDAGDDEAYGLAMMVHLKGGRFIGADNGGCKVSGTLEPTPDGRYAMHLVYKMKCGSHLPDGSVLEADRTIVSDSLYESDAADGAPQLVDVGLGPMHIRLLWLAEPA